MLRLTGKQKRHLRSLGQNIQPSIIVGKSGVTASVIEATEELLSRRELVKVRLPAGDMAQRKATAERLAEAVQAVCPAVMGRTALLYRPGELVPAEERVDLPDRPGDGRSAGGLAPAPDKT